MKKKVYILNEQGKYVGEGIEAFGISYVNKTEVAPDSKFLNGDYDVIWNGKEWEYILVKTEEPEVFISEPTEEEIKAQQEELERQRIEWKKEQAQEQFPYLWELFENKLKELGVIKSIKSKKL